MLKLLATGTGLYQGESHQLAAIDMWTATAINDCYPIVDALTSQVFGHSDPDTEVAGFAKKELTSIIAILDQQLKQTTYIAGGSQISIADVAWATLLSLAYRVAIDEKARSKFAKVNEWLETMLAMPEFVAICGRARFCRNAQAIPTGIKVPKKTEIPFFEENKTKS
jgi:glutathione S-transferase